MNSTDTFDSTGMLATRPKNETDDWATEASLYSTPLLISSTAAQISTPPLPQNRFFVPTNTADQHITVPNDVSAASFNVTSSHSTKFNSTSSMTSSYDNKNSSNTSFSVRFTTMKPCKLKLS